MSRPTRIMRPGPVLAAGRVGPPVDAGNIPYDNDETGLAADDVQEAIDELYDLIGGGSVVPSVIYSAEYGVTADGTTDDTAARQAAIDAAVTEAISGSGVAVVRHPWGIIQHDGALVTSGNYYAQVTLPDRAGSSSKIAIIEEPEGWYGDVLFPGGLQSTAVKSPVVFRSSLTGQSYSGTHGWPSITGGPDPEKTANFSNILYHVRGIVTRAPNNPTVCGFNLQRLNQAIVEDCYFDTADTITGGITEPTAPTGVSVLMPLEGNNAVAEYRGNVWAVGWYGGPGVTEHTRAESIAAYQCKVGTPVQGNYYHAATIQNLATEHCEYGLATIDPTSGPADPSGASGYTSLNIHNWTVEHATSGWGVPTADIYDPSDDYRGRANVIIITAGTGNPAPPQALTLTGAAEYGIEYIVNGPGGGGGGSPTGSAGGDLGGSYPNPDVVAIQGVVVTDAGTTGDVLTKTGAATATWETPGSGTGRWELAVITGSPPDPLYADGDYLYIFVP